VSRTNSLSQRLDSPDLHARFVPMIVIYAFHASLGLVSRSVFLVGHNLTKAGTARASWQLPRTTQLPASTCLASGCLCIGSLLDGGISGIGGFHAVGV
jgi:hypothetical protein